MNVSRILPLLLGALAVSSGVTVLAFDIIFAVTLPPSPSPHRVLAIVASGLGGVTVTLLSLLLARQIQYRKRTHIQSFEHGKQHTYLLAGFAGMFGIISGVVSAVLFASVRNRTGLSKRTINPFTSSLLTGAFVCWACSLVSEALFIICMVVIQRKDFQQQIQPYRADAESPNCPEMRDTSSSRTSNAQHNVEHRGTPSMDSKSPPQSSGRSRAGSDTRSFRSSFSQVVRPINSKTKLIQHSHRSPYRPRSIESSHHDPQHETVVTIEDGFDSWDTSAVDAHSREAVASASPTPPRFLATIPASPTGSRSPSPGFPLDLEPPTSRKRSRSYSPANSSKDLPRTSRAQSPTESVNEAHIHPLFRTDSPTPPPAATPGTIVTAAPGNGNFISDRASIRSIHRIRSESLPSSPLGHSDSLESIRNAIEREEIERLEAVGGERTLTPPIPDFIMNGGPRNSMQGYQARKKTGPGMAVLGEA